MLFESEVRHPDPVVVRARGAYECGQCTRLELMIYTGEGDEVPFKDAKFRNLIYITSNVARDDVMSTVDDRSDGVLDTFWREPLQRDLGISDLSLKLQSKLQ